MNVKQAYNEWADQYDSNANRTRDMEATALRQSLKDIPFQSCLEIGCGTGKNTEWLQSKSEKVLAVDMSEAMLQKAKEKINSDKVTFYQADILQPWTFVNSVFDLVVFSLMLEHIENLDEIFKRTRSVTAKGAHVYIGELHPFKQYTGTKARFENEMGKHIVTCFNHNLSDFTQAAKKYGFDIVNIDEYFDDDDRNDLPRILTIVLERK